MSCPGLPNALSLRRQRRTKKDWRLEDYPECFSTWGKVQVKVWHVRLFHCCRRGRTYPNKKTSILLHHLYCWPCPSSHLPLPSVWNNINNAELLPRLCVFWSERWSLSDSYTHTQTQEHPLHPLCHVGQIAPIAPCWPQDPAWSSIIFGFVNQAF